MTPMCSRSAASSDVSYIPYFPLASGLLTGKYRRGEPAPDGTRLAGREIEDERFERVEARDGLRGAAGPHAARAGDRRARVDSGSARSSPARRSRSRCTPTRRPPAAGASTGASSTRSLSSNRRAAKPSSSHGERSRGCSTTRVRRESPVVRSRAATLRLDAACRRRSGFARRCQHLCTAREDRAARECSRWLDQTRSDRGHVPLGRAPAGDGRRGLGGAEGASRSAAQSLTLELLEVDAPSQA